MLKIKEAVVVEGIYDKNRLSTIVDTAILCVNGFTIFKDSSTIAALRLLAQERGLVILTDSDRAGFLIRRYILQCVGSEHVKNAYIPDLPGKEKRKKKPSKEGLLGVEGMEPERIKQALITAGCTVLEEGAQIKKAKTGGITKQMLYADGLFGTENSHILRQKLQQSLNLPKRLSANALLGVLNQLYTIDDYQKAIQELSAK